MRAKDGDTTIWAEVAGAESPADPAAPDRTLRLLVAKPQVETATSGAPAPRGFDVLVPKGS